LDWIAGTAEKGRGYNAEFATEKPDIVVVQVSVQGEWGQSDQAHERFIDAMETYRRGCDAVGARLIICAEPGVHFKQRDAENIEVLQKVMVLFAHELGYEVAPMPMAYGAYYNTAAGTDLHAGGDVYHLTPRDAYLAACCLVHTILQDRDSMIEPSDVLRQSFNAWNDQKRTAEGSGSATERYVPLAADQQKQIHQAAWRAVSDFRNLVEVEEATDAAAKKRVAGVAANGGSGINNLVGQLKGGDKYAARYAALALGAMGDVAEEAVPALLDALTARDLRLPDLSEKALALLAADSQAIAGTLAAETKANDPWRAIRSAAALAGTGETNEKLAASVLIRHLRDKDERLARKSIDRAVVLAKETNSMSVWLDVVTALSNMLKNRQSPVGRTIATGLGQLGRRAEVAVPVLKDAILSGAVFKKEAEAALRNIQPGKKVETTVTIDDIGDGLLGF
jgi:hypothetical protein